MNQRLKIPLELIKKFENLIEMHGFEKAEIIWENEFSFIKENLLEQLKNSSS